MKEKAEEGRISPGRQWSMPSNFLEGYRFIWMITHYAPWKAMCAPMGGKRADADAGMLDERGSKGVDSSLWRMTAIPNGPVWTRRNQPGQALRDRRLKGKQEVPTRKKAVWRPFWGEKDIPLK